VTGMQVKYDTYGDYDDTGITGLRMWCSPFENTNVRNLVTVVNGPGGRWRRKVFGNDREFVTGVRVRMEYTGHDVTGLNGIDIDFTHFEKPYTPADGKNSKIKAIARWNV